MTDNIDKFHSQESGTDVEPNILPEEYHDAPDFSPEKTSQPDLLSFDMAESICIKSKQSQTTTPNNTPMGKHSVTKYKVL